MATKNNPGAFKCYEAALPDEEFFTALARDLAAPATVDFWCDERERLGLVKTEDDRNRINEARRVAQQMRMWRAKAVLDATANNEEPIWRQPRQIMDDGPPVCVGAMRDPITIKQALLELKELEINPPAREMQPGNPTNHIRKVRLINKMIDAIDATTESVPSVFEVDEVPVADEIKSTSPPRQTFTYFDHPDAEGREIFPLSPVRICELLDYATAYGEMDETTPNGTVTPMSTEPMSDMRRAAIVIYKRVLGVLPEDFDFDTVDQGAEARTDMRTHYRAWRTALSQCIRNAPHPTADQDDAAYWRHEREVLDRTFRALGYTTGPIPQDMPRVAMEAEGIKLSASANMDANAVPDDGEIADAARRIASWVEQSEGQRAAVYKIAKAELAEIAEDAAAAARPNPGVTSVMTTGMILVHGKAMDIREIERRIPPDWVPTFDRPVRASPALGMGYSGKDPYRAVAESILDSDPEDLAHAPEMPGHRFASFVKYGRYAYARGLEIAPMHLPRALNAMAHDGWHLVCCFGQTDSQNVGFIFQRDPEIPALPDLVPSREELMRRVREEGDDLVKARFMELGKPYRPENENPRKDPGLDLGRQQEP